MSSSRDSRPAGTDPESCVAAQYREGDAYVVVLRGSVDLDGAEPVREALEAAAASGSECVIADLSAMTFGDSTMLNLLLRAHSTCSLRIAGPGEAVSRLFQLTSTDTVLDIYPTLKAALAGGNRPADA
ncbi:STAS domain-containing protein [Streptomyces sp. NPDC059740]|uniref:STAS domain-containing protein n=1 Tax=Streptomyces sp. NPDC059740 TaxID=3346926 RepID=UPI00364F9F68